MRCTHDCSALTGVCVSEQTDLLVRSVRRPYTTSVSSMILKTSWDVRARLQAHFRQLIVAGSSRSCAYHGPLWSKGPGLERENGMSCVRGEFVVSGSIKGGLITARAGPKEEMRTWGGTKRWPLQILCQLRACCFFWGCGCSVSRPGASATETRV